MKKYISGYLCVLVITLLLVGGVKTQQQSSPQHIDTGSAGQSQGQMDGRMSRSQQIQMQERQRFKKVQQNVAVDTKFTNLLFTVQGVEEFMLNLPVAQQVAVNMFIYEIKDSAYIRPQNIQNQAPIKIFVYENNNRLIHQSYFYFQNYIVFQGQQLSTYTIRFINPGAQKLITMSLKKVTETSHIQDIITSTVLSDHSTRASRLLEQIKFLTNAFERYTVINFQAVKAVLNNINIYYYWNIIETVVAIVVCLVQVTFIRRVCRVESIV